MSFERKYSVPRDDDNAMKMPAFASILVGLLGGQQSPSLLGRWVGESRCIGSQPACHDEHVIYQIDSAGPHHFTFKGGRTAGADTVDMGDLSCDNTAGDPALVCHIPLGVWRFSVEKGRLEGVLTESGGKVTRRATADRAPTR